MLFCTLLSTIVYFYYTFLFPQRKEAEEMRQHCETLNNIVLAEFDYYSKTMVNDFETIILNLLKEQATYHRQVRTFTVLSCPVWF